MTEQVLQFKITLRDTTPEVWRRIQVPGDYTFWDVHVAVQCAMGWTDSHLHEFEIGGIRSRRMVMPYHVWMLQRLSDVLRECGDSASQRSAIEGLLAGFPGGGELLELDRLLGGCRVRKQGGLLFSFAE